MLAEMESFRQLAYIMITEILQIKTRMQDDMRNFCTNDKECVRKLFFELSRLRARYPRSTITPLL